MSATSAAPPFSTHSQTESTRRWFDPASITVVGASARPGNAGASYVRALQHFKGELSVVHPSGASVLGAPGHERIEDLPAAPDLAIVAVPAQEVAATIDALARVGCRAVHVFTGGFAEIGTEEATARQAEVSRVAAAHGVDLLGPNCMGVHRPAAAVTFRSDLPMLPGPVGVVAQSGGVAINLILMLAARGVGTSAVVSYGNAALLDGAWWAEAVADLPETGAVIVHAESRGAPDLAARLEALGRRVSVVLLRPRGEEGWLEAARRHTGLPGGRGVPAPGLTAVHSVDDACNVAELALAAGPAPVRSRAAFVTISGGVGVFAAGEFAAAGAPLALIPPDLRRELENLDGTSLVAAGNPVDLGPRFLSRRLLADVVARLSKSDAVDVVIIHVPWDSIGEIDAGRPGYAADFLGSIGTFASWGRVVAYFPPLGLPGEDAAREALRRHGVAVSTSLSALAASAADPARPEEHP